MRREIIPFLLAAALVGSACQRQPEAQTAKPVLIVGAKPAEAQAPPPPRAEAQKPAVVEKAAIRLKPEELYQKLLATPIQPDKLPPGITVVRNGILKLDPEDQALKAIGRVFLFVNDKRAPTQSRSGIIYTLFPNASAAKGAYDFHSSLAMRMNANTHPLEDFGYPAFINSFDLFYEHTGAKCMVLVDNVLVLSGLNGPFNQTVQRDKTISLATAAIAHLQRVGR